MLKVPTLTRPKFDIASLRVADTEVIFRLAGGSYRKAVLDGPIRELLAQVLRTEYEKYDLATQQNWQDWDYSNEPLSEDKLLFPWRAEELAEMGFLLRPGALERLGGVEEALRADAYFVDFVDGNDQHIIGVREMRTLKSVQKKKIGFFSDGNKLSLLNEQVIQIGDTFNFIFDSENAFVFNPKMFEFIVNLDAMVAAAVEQNIIDFSTRCKIIKWPGMTNTAARYKRFGKHLRSIMQRGEFDRFDYDKIKIGLIRKGIEFTEHDDGTIEPHPNHEFDFIKFLDHRIFDIEISSDPATPYEATNRRRKT